MVPRLRPSQDAAAEFFFDTFRRPRLYRLFPFLANSHVCRAASTQFTLYDSH